MKNAQTFTYGTIKIDKVNSSDALVPTEAIKVEMNPTDRKALALAMRDNLSCLLIGETGTGKTSAIKELAFLSKQPYARVNMNGYTTPDELIGTKSVKDGATYFENGIITDAMQRGAILVLDEINATTPDCLFILHGLLDEDRRITLPNGEVITPHKNFRVFATCNPDYEGTKSMNKAFIDRFPIIIAVDTLSPAKEKKLIIDRTGLDEATANNLVTIATMARQDYADNKIFTFISTRSLIAVAKLINAGLSTLEAYKLSIVRKAQDKNEQKLLTDIYNAVLKLPTEIDNPDRAVLTTQGELDRLLQARKNYYDQARNAIDEKDKLENELIDERNEKRVSMELNETLQLEVKKVNEEKDALAKRVEMYESLDNIIKQVARANTTSAN